MLNEFQRELVKSTVPVLKIHGEVLTKHFYKRMFRHNPELKSMFNQGHQQSGVQQKALAGAVTAYAEHIDDPSVLMSVLNMVANKHASLGIRKEHYPIVGTHLLASIREVLGEAANNELLEAWGLAYAQLQDVLVGMESELYMQAAQKKGSWTGWRTFKVQQKVMESEEICSFYLEPADGGHLPEYQAGQYLTVRVFVPSLGIMQPRQYSLSQASGGDVLRISVKRERSAGINPSGMVSNCLHDTIGVGDLLDIAAPMGNFVLHDNSADAPIVLISAGVGITPMIAMLETLLSTQPQRPVLFIHACRNGRVHAFKPWIKEQQSKFAQLTTMVYYEKPHKDEEVGVDFDREGRLDLARVVLPLSEKTDYYLCGPIPFMKIQKKMLIDLGANPTRIYIEAFGSGGEL